MKPKYAQAKGDRFEKYLIGRFRVDLDINTHKTAGSGNGIDKNDIRMPSLNIEVEAKNQKNILINDWWEQTENQMTPGNLTVLAIRHPKHPEFKKTLIVMDLEDFIALVQDRGGEREVVETLDPKIKWKLKNFLNTGKELLKHFDKNGSEY